MPPLGFVAHGCPILLSDPGCLPSVLSCDSEGDEEPSSRYENRERLHEGEIDLHPGIVHDGTDNGERGRASQRTLSIRSARSWRISSTRAGR